MPDSLQVTSEAPAVQILRPADNRFPAALADLPQTPKHLYALGNPDLLGLTAVSIVGTRDFTPYGERATRNITRALAQAGVCIVSGMARGIDATAHRTALELGSPTIAVLGTGVDVAYPAGHRPLHRRIISHGLVLSENPPGTTAYPGCFPRRNRIIAALARLTIVVEAGQKSGALNTANQATELGRLVAAVPGPIDSEQSAGTNRLLRDGASVIASPADALALLGLGPPPPECSKPNLPAAEQRVWEATGFVFTDVDAVALKTGLAFPECLAAITSLELMGLIECSMAGEIRRR